MLDEKELDEEDLEDLEDYDDLDGEFDYEDRGCDATELARAGRYSAWRNVGRLAGPSPYQHSPAL